MPELSSHPLDSLSGRVALRLESLWLGVLPSLTRHYAWCQADGLRMYGSSHHGRKLALMQKGSFEPFTVDLFKQSVKPGMVVLDLGAYLGYFALLAARQVGSQGKVYAFECDPRSYRFLLHNIKTNKCSRTVVALPKAVAEDCGRRQFFFQGGDLSRSSLWDDHHAEATHEVECTTVDAMFANQRVDVIKMDVEGGEIKALEGMKRTLSNIDEVVLFVECNPSALSKAGGSAELLIRELENNGFRIEVIDEGQRRLTPVTDHVYAERDDKGRRNYCNLYCRKG